MRSTRPRWIDARALVAACLTAALMSGVGSAQTTPELITSDTIAPGLWSVGGGMVYWLQEDPTTCCGVSDCSGYPERLRRRLASGLFPPRNLDAWTCAPRRHSLVADDSGLYYVEDTTHLVRFPIEGTPFPISGPFATVYLMPIVLDDHYAFQASQPAPPIGSFIDAYAKEGAGASITCFSGNPSATASNFVSFGDYLFWADATRTWSVPKCSLGANPAGVNIAQSIVAVSYGIMFRDDHRFSFRGVCSGGQMCTGIEYVLAKYVAGAEVVAFGNMAAHGRVVYFMEELTNATARLRRLDAISGQIDDLATGLPISDLHVETDESGVYFRTASGLSRLGHGAAPIQYDLAYEDRQITQAIGAFQQFDSGKRVANRATYIRVFPRQFTGPPALTVSATIHGSRNGIALPGSPLSPIANSVLSTATTFVYAPDPANKKEGFLFKLPRSWVTAGNTDLQIDVDPRHAYRDPNRANNVHHERVTFTEKAPECLVFVPVRTFPQTAIAEATHDPSFAAMIDLMRRLHPVPAVWWFTQSDDVAKPKVCWAGPFPYPCFEAFALPENDSELLELLTLRMLLTDDPDVCDRANALTHYVGMVSDSTFTPTGVKGVFETGKGAQPGLTFWNKLPPPNPSPPTGDWTYPKAGASLAHELAHNYGRSHVACSCGSAVPAGSASYPYQSNCQLGMAGYYGDYGFDPASLTPIAPTGTDDNTMSDIMSYACRKWTSMFTWDALFDFQKHPTVELAASATVATPATGSSILVTGSITPSSANASIGYAWTVPAEALGTSQTVKWSRISASTVAAITKTGYHLQLRGPSGVADDRAVEPYELERLDESTPVMLGFAATLPLPEKPVTEMILLDDTTVLARRAIGLAAPAVALTAPTGGEIVDDSLTVAWTASDSDPGDQLRFAVQYSRDLGAHWAALATDVGGTPGTDGVSVTLEGLAGSGPGTALVRVLASDGFHTALATSNPFTVRNRPPTVQITAPGEGQVIPATDPVVLHALAMDAEDGGLPDASVQWTLDGVAVGSSDDLSLQGIAPGAHELALTATDSSGGVGAATRHFTVAPLVVPLVATSPTLDGSCDDDSYGGAARVALAPYADGTQATVLLVRTPSDLWACFTNLAKTDSLGPRAGIQFDPNDGRDVQAQADDFGYFVEEDGAVTAAGGSLFAGGAAPPAGARVATAEGSWSAELQIPAGYLSGWGHTIGLSATHLDVGSSGDQRAWPAGGRYAQPSTWGDAVLGNPPDASCYDGDPCTSDHFDVASAACVFTPISGCCVDDDGCGDGNACNGLERCVDHACVPGTAADCDDADACTTDTCVSESGCRHVAPSGLAAVACRLDELIADLTQIPDAVLGDPKLKPSLLGKATKTKDRVTAAARYAGVKLGKKLKSIDGKLGSFTKVVKKKVADREAATGLVLLAGRAREEVIRLRAQLVGPASRYLDVDLLIDGDAESGLSSSDGNEVTGAAGWITTGSFTIVPYGAPGGFPTATDPGPPVRGANFFAGGPSPEPAIATQTIDVGALGDLVDAGVITYDGGGFFGGYASQDDAATLELSFEDVDGTPVGSTTIGGVTATDRGSVTGLLSRRATGAVPSGTRRIGVRLTMTSAGGYNDGYADALTLVLTKAARR